MAFIKSEFTIPSVVGDCDLRGSRWLPKNGEVRAVLQIIHGMLEHIGRYDAFADFFTSRGFAVYGVSHLGHGLSVNDGILEIMWVWNDYLLPYLVLDINEYRTIPIHIQYLKGSYGTVDLGATMALILLSIIPVIIFYLVCQKHIIKGVAAGAVKG